MYQNVWGAYNKKLQCSTPLTILNIFCQHVTILGAEGTVELPIEFHAKKAGHYSCKVVLRSHDDVRVYQIECTVIPEGNEAHIEFSVALHQPLNQNIPIVSIFII